MTIEGDRIDIQTFIRRARVSVEDVTRADPPARHVWATAEGASHWHVTITREGARTRVSVPFHMGVAHDGPPTLGDVLDSLASEAAGYDDCNRDYWTWCRHHGLEPYDGDRLAETAAFGAVARQSTALLELFGEELYDTLLRGTRRLRTQS